MPLDPPLEDDPDTIRDALAPLRNGLSIAVETPGNAFAVGAIIRVAHSFLVRDVILVGTDPHYEKASMGMHRIERVVRVDDVEAFFTHINDRPIYAFEREHATESLYDLRAFPDDAVFAFGSERFGLSRAILARARYRVAIPLYGVNNSLPVAVAVGIALSHWASVRYRGATIVGPRRSP